MSALPITNNACGHSLASQMTGCSCANHEVVPHTNASSPSLLLQLPTSGSARGPAVSFPAILSTSKGPTTVTDYSPLTVAGVTRTYASYNQQPVPELVQQTHSSWILNLSIPIPKNSYNPTLLSLTYIIKYATTHDNGDSTVQADLVISPKDTVAEGILFDAPGTGLYRTARGIGYGPQIVDEERATCLSSVLGIKSNAGSATWSHYIDHQRLYPSIRFPGYPTKDGSSAGLYLAFHVNEYPTAQTHRNLSVEVAATWSEDVAARKAAEHAAAEKARKEKEAREAKELEEKKKAEDELKKKIQDEVDARSKEVEKRLKDEADKRIKDEVKAKVEEAEKLRNAAAAAHAPDGSAADGKIQDLIEQKIKELNIQPCPNGYGYVRNNAAKEYRCSGGSHHITFAQLGI